MPDMTLTRALDLVGRINDQAFIAMGLYDADRVAKLVGGMSLDGVTLAELVDAASAVKAHNDSDAAVVNGMRTIYVVPDDRLIAAAYVAAHYHPDARENITTYPVPTADGGTLLAVRVVDLGKE